VDNEWGEGARRQPVFTAFQADLGVTKVRRRAEQAVWWVVVVVGGGRGRQVGRGAEQAGAVRCGAVQAGAE
jgi:hypothetical protein